jgi:hypothetical protein
VPLAASALRLTNRKKEQMKVVHRLSGLLVAIVVSLGVMAHSAPAQAAIATETTSSASPAVSATAASIEPRAATASQRASAGGCGFLQVCLFFNKSEQTYIAGASIAGISALVCSTGVGCGVAAAVAFALGKYVDSHGVCPKSKPRLQVKVFPTAHFDPVCVS